MYALSPQLIVEEEAGSPTALLPDERGQSGESSGKLGVRQRIGFHVGKLGIDVSLLLGVRDGHAREESIEGGEEGGEVDRHLSCLGYDNTISQARGVCTLAVSWRECCELLAAGVLDGDGVQPGFESAVIIGGGGKDGEHFIVVGLSHVVSLLVDTFYHGRGEFARLRIGDRARGGLNEWRFTQFIFSQLEKIFEGQREHEPRCLC